MKTCIPQKAQALCLNEIATFIVTIVYSSDGMGRTGTFCALMMCHDRLKTEHMADVFYAIKTIRAQRPGMVENAVRNYHHLCATKLVKLCCVVKGAIQVHS